jgi:hypothetical protein
MLPQAAGADVAERNEDVLALVRELIAKYPTVNSTQLYDKAVRVHPFLEDDGLRTFHARYVLPIRRAQAVADGRPRAPRRRKTQPATPQVASAPAVSRVRSAAGVIQHERDHVRSVMLRFARALAAAESRADIVAMLSGVDSYVDDIMKQPSEHAPG